MSVNSNSTEAPTKGQIIQLQDDQGRIVAFTWVDDMLSYCMNGAYKVRDKAGVTRLVTQTRGSGLQTHWRCIG